MWTLKEVYILNLTILFKHNILISQGTIKQFFSPSLSIFFNNVNKDHPRQQLLAQI